MSANNMCMCVYMVMECTYCYVVATSFDLYYYNKLLSPVAVLRRWIIASKLKRPVIYNYVTT